MRPALSLALLLAACGSAQGNSFMGYACADDCTTHKAGYDWAEDHEITDEADCAGESRSFEEGCRGYLRDYRGEE